MSSSHYPRRAPLTVVSDEGGLQLHDTHTGSVHRLEAAVRHLWELCDGTRDAAALADAMSANFPFTPLEARRWVDSALDQFAAVGLLLTPAPSARDHEVLTQAVATAIGARRGEPHGGLAGVNWNAVVHVAVDHGVMPLLYRSVADHWRDDVPGIVCDRLRRQYEANAAVVDGYLQELLDIVRDLAAQTIDVLPLRGPALADQLYGSAALRQFGDLDLFVRPGDAARVIDVLERRGYQLRARRRTDALAVRASVAGDIWIDLQWSLARPVFRFPVRLEEVWEQTIGVEVGGTPVRQPAPEDHLLILCAHASKHCWSSLVWIADIAAFVLRYGERLRWTHLLERAAAAGGERQLLLGLSLAGDLLDAELPLAVRERLRHTPSVQALVADVRRTLFTAVEQRTFQGSFGLLRGGIFYLQTRERMRDRVPYAAHLLTESVSALGELARPNHLDREFVSLPRVLSLLYYPVRLVRVTWKWGTWLAARRPRALMGRAPTDTGGSAAADVSLRRNPPYSQSR